MAIIEDKIRKSDLCQQNLMNGEKAKLQKCALKFF